MEPLKPKWQSENQPITVHTIYIGDVEDPDLLVGMNLYEWENSEEGKWVMEKSMPSPIWKREIKYDYAGWTYKIVAFLSEVDCLYYKLKFK